MKQLAIILTLLLIPTQVLAASQSANYNKKPAQKTQATKPVNQAKQQATNNDNDYLLKYNINDLEAAPWLNGGQRKY